MAEQPGRCEPFERCGYTVHRSGSPLADYSDLVRVSKDGWAAYLTAEFYDDGLGDDDIAFETLMDAWREQAPKV